MASSERFETPVLIIGAGPTGLVSALLLAKYGIRSTVVERRHGTTTQPKAHAINPRSLEILRQLGLDTHHLRKLGMSAVDGSAVRFGLSMAGLELGRLSYERQGDETKSITPEPLFNIPQPVLEDYLRQAVDKTKMITVLTGTEHKEVVGQPLGSQISTLLERDSSRSIQVVSKYLLACDGANSCSRAKFGIPFTTLPGHTDATVHHVSVHIRADLRRFKPATLWWFLTPTQPGTFICYNRASSWVYVFNFDPVQTSPESFTEEYCRSLIDNVIGDKVTYDVLSITPWTTLPKAADFYRSREITGAFLVGDAAHAFPPTGGLGLNTGIADAHNLAWKIYAVERKWSDERLFDVYERDRRPIALANARQSAKNQQKIRKLFQVISESSLDELEARWLRDQEFCKKVHEAITDNTEHFDSINLQIGYVYGDDSRLLEPCGQYNPRCVVGVRLPHAWVIRGGLSCSTLDLIDGTSFVLLAGTAFLRGQDNKFCSGQFSVPVVIFRLEEHFTDPDGAWTRLMQLESGNFGVLIQPDQHILGRVASLADIESCLSQYLGPW